MISKKLYVCLFGISLMRECIFLWFFVAVFEILGRKNNCDQILLNMMHFCYSYINIYRERKGWRYEQVQLLILDFERSRVDERRSIEAGYPRIDKFPQK